MARITMHVVKTFIETDVGLVAEEMFKCIAPGDARATAQVLSEGKAGVVAWSKSGDPDTRAWDDDPVILFQARSTGDL